MSLQQNCINQFIQKTTKTMTNLTLFFCCLYLNVVLQTSREESYCTSLHCLPSENEGESPKPLQE